MIRKYVGIESFILEMIPVVTMYVPTVLVCCWALCLLSSNAQFNKDTESARWSTNLPPQQPPQETQKTLLRTAWGMYFDKVQTMISGDAVVHYVHTLHIGLPLFTYAPYPEIICDINSPKYTLCEYINLRIKRANVAAYECAAYSAHAVHTMLTALPQQMLTLDEIESIKTQQPKDTNNDDGVQMKRYIHSPHTRHKRYIYGDGYPQQQKKNIKQSNSKLAQAIGSILDVRDKLLSGSKGYNQLAQGWADLWHMVGPKEILQLKQHAQHVSDALSINAKGVISFNNRMAGVALATDHSLTVIHSAIMEAGVQLNTVKGNMQTEIRFVNNKTEQILLAVDFMKQSLKEVVSYVDPYMNNFYSAINLQYRCVRQWQEGMNSLLRGSISTQIVPVEHIETMLSHIRKVVLPAYGNLALLNEAASFYYTLHNIHFANINGSVMISMTIPLYKPANVLNVYRTAVFNVPTIAGLDPQETHDSDGNPLLNVDVNAYTKLIDIPTFIAVTADTLYYIEISAAQFITCKKNVALTCPMVRQSLHRISEGGCVAAIFVDNSKRVKEICNVRYTKEPTPGSATHINGHNSFLLHKSAGDITDFWTLTCPHRNPQVSSVKPCEICLSDIPCDCRLTGAAFTIPQLHSRCWEQDPRNKPTVSFQYPINKHTIYALLPFTVLAEMNADFTLRDAYVKGVKVPKQLTLHYDISKYVAADKKGTSDYKKLIKAQLENVTLFDKHIDKYLHDRALNLSDVYFSREGSIVKAATDLFEIFGSSVYTFITVLCSQQIISLVAFCLALLMFIPALLEYIIYKIDSNSHHSKQKEVNDSDTYQNTASLLVASDNNDINKEDFATEYTDTDTLLMKPVIHYMF